MSANYLVSALATEKDLASTRITVAVYTAHKGTAASYTTHTHT